MFSFWISAALLTVLAVLALVWPLLRSGRADGEPAGEGMAGATRSAADVAIYRSQIAEVDADKARGLISETEAEAARIEIARRLLATASATSTSPTDDPAAPLPDVDAARLVRKTSERAFTVVAFAVPAVALGLYALVGSPTLPGRPLAERVARAPAANAGVEELIARVEAQLRANPADGRGWDVIAPVYLRLERYQDAAEAYRRAVDILGEDARRMSGLAESTMLANDGVVTEAARQAYARLLELEPDRTEARFGLALAKEQDGKLDEAEADYRALLENAPPQVPWRLFVMERLQAISQRRGDGRPPGAAEAPGAAGAEVAALPEAERRQVIISMVEGLSAKLAADGHDLDGWQRLLRSWTVLGEPAKAEAALVAARKALAGNDDGLARINAFARSLGLKS